MELSLLINLKMLVQSSPDNFHRHTPVLILKKAVSSLGSTCTCRLLGSNLERKRIVQMGTVTKLLLLFHTVLDFRLQLRIPRSSCAKSLQSARGLILLVDKDHHTATDYSIS